MAIMKKTFTVADTPADVGWKKESASTHRKYPATNSQMTLFDRTRFMMVRADHQPQDRQDARPRHALVSATARRRGDRVTGLFCCGCAQPLLAGCVAKLFQQVSCWRAILGAGPIGSTLSRSNFGLAEFSLRTRGMIS